MSQKWCPGGLLFFAYDWNGTRWPVWFNSSETSLLAKQFLSRWHPRAFSSSQTTGCTPFAAALWFHTTKLRAQWWRLFASSHLFITNLTALLINCVFNILSSIKVFHSNVTTFIYLIPLNVSTMLWFYQAAPTSSAASQLLVASQCSVYSSWYRSLQRMRDAQHPQRVNVLMTESFCAYQMWVKNF